MVCLRLSTQAILELDMGNDWRHKLLASLGGLILSSVCLQIFSLLVLIAIPWFLRADMRPAFVAFLVGVAIAVGIDWFVYRARKTNRSLFPSFISFVGALLAVSYVPGLVMLLPGRVLPSLDRVFTLIMFIAILFVPWFFLKNVQTYYKEDEAVPLSLQVFKIAARTIVFWIGIVSIPFLTAWYAGTLVWQTSDRSGSIYEWLRSEQPNHGGQTILARMRSSGCSSEEIEEFYSIDTGVALSGGGYRAALLHAGLLAALEDHCVAVRLITSVSGGSIIGTAYALGVPPTEFARRLVSKKPHLANDLLQFGTIFDEIFGKGEGFTGAYADHLRRLYFGDLKLSNLPDLPILLLNVTNLEANREHGREVLFKGMVIKELKTSWPKSLTLFNLQDLLLKVVDIDLDQQLLLADVVAASSAFPGPFQPKLIQWHPRIDFGKNIADKFRFSDGGIVENLGLEGLRRFLTLEATVDSTDWVSLREREILAGNSDNIRQLMRDHNKTLLEENEEQRNSLSSSLLHIKPKVATKRPRLLIISDGSGHGSPSQLEPKNDLFTLAALTLDFSYELLHRQLYALYTGHPDPLRWVASTAVEDQVGVVKYSQIDDRLAEGSPEDLFTVAIPMTAIAMEAVLKRYSKCNFEVGLTGTEIHKHVRELVTLRELEPHEANEAFWLGYALGKIYYPAMRCAQLRIKGETCDEKAIAKTVKPNLPFCPTLSELIKR